MSQREVSAEDAYFHFLYAVAFGIPELKSRSNYTDALRNIESRTSYTTVCHEMHLVRFLDLVPHDENRIADAAELANTFLQNHGPFSPLEQSDILMRDASVLEVLVALAQRADFQIPLTVVVWMQIFIKNLGLEKYNDEYCLTHAIWPVHRAIKNFNGRNYKRNGNGGIFPLRRSSLNQRTVELWYQMGAYMTDQGMY